MMIKRIAIPFMVALAIGGMMNTATAADTSDDVLDPTKAYKTEFWISHHIGENSVYARASFLAPNSRELPASDTLTVNGIPFVGKPHMKPGWLGSFRTGYEYGVHIPVAERYEIVLRHVATGEESHFEILPRKFAPQIPKKISRHQDLRIPFEGPPLAQGEKVSAYIELADSQVVKQYQPRGFSLIRKVIGNDIIVDAAHSKDPIIKAGLADVHLGLSILSIGIDNTKFINNKHHLSFIISQSLPVVVEE
jgi:hypothetical protein